MKKHLKKDHPIAEFFVKSIIWLTFSYIVLIFVLGIAGALHWI